jgi:Carboxypeptidase regulatory-like domain
MYRTKNKIHKRTTTLNPFSVRRGRAVLRALTCLRRLPTIAAGGILILLACGIGYAQMDLAAITGTVMDNTGAVIPSCQIEVKNVATSAIRTTPTNAQGNYSVPSLPVGSYEITITAAGFQTVKSTVDLALTGATANFRLNVASTSSQVTVEGSASQIQLQSDSHDVSQVVNSVQLTTLPNSGRNLINTATLGPASQPGTDMVNNGGDVGFFNQTSNAAYIAGLDNYHTLFLQDGVENINLLDQTANILASVEAVQEVETTLNNAPARFAQPAVINVITKSGTNKFHGTAYDFLQNDAFNARNWYSTSVPIERYNLFGANLGGPILKNRLFGFFDYSGLRNGSAGLFTGRVPTLAERGGDFSADPTIYDPATYNAATGTSLPFPNNVIPNDRFNQFANLWLPNYPDPNTPLTSNNVNYIENLPNSNNYDEYLGRGDWNINPQNQLLGSIVQKNGLIGGSSITPDLFGIDFSSKGVNAMIEETATISPNIVNVGKIGYNRSIVNRTQEGAGAKNYAVYYGLLGLNAAPVQWAPPYIGINGYAGLGDPYSPQGATQNRFQYADEVNWRVGNHNLYFGAQFVRTQFYGYWVVNNNGNYTFAGNATAQYAAGAVNTIGNGFADFLLGYPESAIAAVGVSADPFRSTAVSGYIQDDWKILPSLTLNIGLRYDFPQPPYDIKHHAAVITPDLTRYVVGATNSNYNDWGPRFGFAYSHKDYVFRGGYGIYYAGNQWENLQFQLLYPPNVTQKSYQFSITNQQPIQTAVSTSGPGAGLLSPFAMPESFKDPSAQEWNLNIERSLGANTRLVVGYLGNVARHVESRADINQPYALSPGNTSGILDVRPNPNYSFIYGEVGRAPANYNALIASADRRFAHGLQFLASYTWSKSMDLLDGDNGNITNQYNPGLSYAPAGWDRTNNFILSGVYDLPVGPGRQFASTDNWFNRLVIGGWQFSGIYLLASGQPIQVSAVNNTDGSPYVTIWANKICDTNSGFQKTRFHIFNATCLAQPPNGVYGVGGRYAGRNPRENTESLSLSKAFKIYESHELEFRAEAFGAFNHPIFFAGGGVVGTPGLGQVTSAGGQRVGQFALRYTF